MISRLQQRWNHYYNNRWRIPMIMLDLELGRRAFRDLTRFTENFRGRYYLYRARLASWQRDSDSVGAKSWKLGYRHLGRVASAERMRDLRERLDAAFKTGRAQKIEFRGLVVMTAMQQANEVVPELMELLTDDVLAAVRQYYRSNFRLYNVGAWRNRHVPDIGPQDDTLSNNWHTDLRRVDMVKVFITASDVTEDDGPTHVLDRQWTREVIRRGFRHRRDYGLPIEVIENPDHLVKLTGPAGTALLVNTNLCFHRAGLPAEGHTRDLIEFRFIAWPRQDLTLPNEAELPLRDRVAS